MRNALGLCLVAWCACAPLASAQTNIWTGNGPGNWSDPTKWSLGYAPISGLNGAQINDGSTVEFDVPMTSSITGIRLGNNFGESGALNIAAGSLGCTSFYVGNLGDGSVTISGTGQIQCTGFDLAVADIGSTGFALQTGGVVDVTGIDVGVRGTAVYDFQAGTIDLNSLRAGILSGSVGLFVQTGGDLSATSIRADHDGNGAMRFLGGTTQCGILYVGNGTDPQGFILIGGSAEVTCTFFRIGTLSTGVVTQNGGTVDVTHVVMSQIAGTGYGEYHLDGGVLDMVDLEYTDGLLPLFEMTGGTLIVQTFATPAKNLDLTPSGGLILPGGKNLGTTTVHGNHLLGAGAAIRFQLDTPATSDRMIVNGRVNLMGSFIGLLLATPSPGDVFTLIDNDDVESTVGSFIGLPEGATVALTDPSLAVHNFEITYQGGDGNDVQLNFVPCPPDLNNDGILDNADIQVFVAFFLAGDLGADFNNDGVLDNGDIQDFIAAFLAGC